MFLTVHAANGATVQNVVAAILARMGVMATTDGFLLHLVLNGADSQHLSASDLIADILQAHVGRTDVGGVWYFDLVESNKGSLADGVCPVYPYLNICLS